jgi:pSer/pThr/pTyr-binding forkhead associated (FHA) protein
VFRDAEGAQRILITSEGRSDLWIGRSPTADVSLEWDPEVSKLHAQLEVVGGDCTLVDDGLSTNGSYVNEDRVSGRKRLNDGDIVRTGKTRILFRAPGEVVESTVVSSDALSAAGISPAQRRVLVALCRPFKSSRRRGEEADAGPVREVRRREPPAEREAGARCGARVRRRVHLQARPLGPSGTKVPRGSTQGPRFGTAGLYADLKSELRIGCGSQRAAAGRRGR